MANTDNNMLDLKLPPLENFSQWDMIFEMQKELQERLGYDFKSMTLSQIADFMMFNKHALEDEIGEMLDALGGIHDGIGNAVWKRWKAKRKIAETTTIDYLTQRDRAELMFEIVDMLHFFINFAVSCGFTGSEIANGYLAKNKENHRRQDNNY